MWTKNEVKIALSLTVIELQRINLMERFRIHWMKIHTIIDPLNILIYPVDQKFGQNCSISYGFQDNCILNVLSQISKSPFDYIVKKS